MHTDEALPSAGGRAAMRVLLGVLLSFGALNAFAGAYYGLAGAPGVPTEWLHGSPFSDYTVPSIILGGVVGGSFLLAAIAVFARWRSARLLAAAAGVIVLGWLVVQLAIIGYVSWMQPATAGWGIAILFVARLLAPRPQGLS
jgi:hypothetical protein